MDGSTSRPVGLYAVGAAASSILLAPLLAIAYLATPEGAEGLQTVTVSAWATPARAAVGVLATFASPDRVYATYTQLFALLVPALFLTAFVTRAKRTSEPRRLERWGWRSALTGYALFAVGLFAVAILLIGGDPSVGLLDPVFMTVMLPGLLIALIGSTLLGIALLRTGYRPRATAWLLTLSFPLWAVGSIVLGHNSIGLLPLFIAWAVTAWNWGANAENVDSERDATSRRHSEMRL